MNKFSSWIKANDKKQRGIATKLGISTATLNAIIKHKQLPNLRLAYKIEKYTMGAITLYDWIDEKALEETE